MRRRQVSRAKGGGVAHTTPPFDLSDDGSESLESRAKRRSLARHTAVGLLARREHAGAEIRRKLRQRGYDDELSEQVVDELTAKRLISDERFAESFIRARAERGQGPIRLRLELRQVQVPAEIIEQHLEALPVDWTELAAQVRARRFGAAPPTSLAERAKQVRFLQYRGFTAGQIRAALAAATVTDDLDELLVADEEPPNDPSDY